MLKRAGVDQFSLAERVRNLDPEQAANLSRIYHSQLAIVYRRIEELRVCERLLVQREFSGRLEAEWIPRLPLDKDTLTSLASGPKEPFSSDSTGLLEIAEHSPIDTTQTLACLALLRTGFFEPQALCRARMALCAQDPEMAIEAALAFAHWRAKAYPDPFGIDTNRLAVVATEALGIAGLAAWAACAVVSAKNGRFGAVWPEGGESPLRDRLQEGLRSGDPDLRFTCAIALGDTERLASALNSHDPQQRLVAQMALARHKSAALASCLSDGTDEERSRILDAISWPLSAELVWPVLQAVERGGERVRDRGAGLLMSQLNSRVVRRLAAVAERKHDRGIFAGLLGQKHLPLASEVVHALIRCGMLQDYFSQFWQNPGRIDFNDEELNRFSRQGGEEVLNSLITIAGRQAQEKARGQCWAAGRFLARAAFEPGPTAIRMRAWGILQEHDSELWNWASVSGSTVLFGTPGGFLVALAKLLRDPAAAEIARQALDHFSASSIKELPPDCVELRTFIQSLRETVCDRVTGNSGLQLPAVGLLVKIALTAPDAGLPALTCILSECGSEWYLRRIPNELIQNCDVLAAVLGTREELATELGVALIAVMVWEENRSPAINLIAGIAEMHEVVRPRVVEAAQARLAQISDPELRSALERLLSLLGVPVVQTPPAVEETERASGCASEPVITAARELEETVLFPDSTLPTLSDYVDFLKSFGGGADPVQVLASRGLTVESYVECVSRWGELLGKRNDLAIRYAILMTPSPAPVTR